MFTITKDIEQKIRYIATNLPTVLQNTCEVHYMTLEEAKEMFPDQTDFPVFQKGQLKGRVAVRMPVQLASNHYRALKKAFRKGGEPAVIAYINKVKSLPAA